MHKHNLAVVALLGESVLAGFGLLWISWRDLPFEIGTGGTFTNVILGIFAAAVMALLNYAVLWWAPPVRGVRDIRRLCRQTFQPLVARVGILELVVIAAAAGVGEELLFRGALQPEIGLIWSSVVFGGLHTAGRETVAFGVWAMFMGVGLGLLAVETNGLLAPTVAHGVYDAVAIGYLRWGELGRR